jgi:hypothetical protein
MAGEWIAGKARGLIGRFFPGEWEDKGGDVLQGRCPAEGMHGHGSARTDARIYLAYGPKGETPGCYCMHNSCKGQLDALNEAFRTELFRRDGMGGGGSYEDGVVLRPPRAREGWIPEFNMGKLRGFARSAPERVDAAWLAERSPVKPASVTSPGEFLEHVFAPGERVVVFTEFKGPGDYLWEVGRGGFRLSPDPKVRAVRSKIPTECGNDGAWYLCNPVDGKWYPNPRRDGRPSRRSQESVTRWKHLVLECDEEKTMRKQARMLREAMGKADPAKWLAEIKADPRWVERMMPLRDGWGEVAARLDAEAPEVSELWLKMLVVSGLPIAAIYTSGGQSVHALVRDEAASYAEFSEKVREYKKRVTLVGADPGALTPVRLTRLPGCKRGGRLQRLLYLDPAAAARSIAGR